MATNLLAVNPCLQVRAANVLSAVYQWGERPFTI